jgi:formate/nitrite transporter FocA (FNT family)
MPSRPPNEIWEESLDEGERRLSRRAIGLAATGFAGGGEIMLGIVAMVVTAGALEPKLGAEGAHIAGSLAFGIGFVLITIGRAELFTENFLIPVGTVQAGRATVRALLKMWWITLALNLVGLLLFGCVFAVKGVLEPAALKSAGTLADLYGQRSVLSALLSAIGAGSVMTLFTWVTAAAEENASRVLLAMLVGFLLGAPSLNHAVVSFGEIGLGLIAGTAHVGVLDLLRNLGLAIAGNLIGGIGLVFTTRLAQVRGEPDDNPAAERLEVPTTVS